MKISDWFVKLPDWFGQAWTATASLYEGLQVAHYAPQGFSFWLAFHAVFLIFQLSMFTILMHYGTKESRL